jgi:hypothetical protein
MKAYQFRSSLKKSVTFGESKVKETEWRTKNQNLIKREPARPGMKDMAEKILPYGQNNAFPLVLAQLVQESPVASSCISTIADFIEGSGFSDENSRNIKLNSQGETLGTIHSINAQTFALYEGIALNIKYNADFKISDIFTIPFENCRLAIPDDNGYISKIRYNPYYGTSQFVKSWTEEYDVYNPDPEIVKSQFEKASAKGELYKGQILYQSFTKPLSRFYSMPQYYSAEYWMRVDAQIGQFHTNNLNNGFYQSVLFRIVGDPNQPSTHPDDQFFNKDTNQLEPIPGTSMGTRMDAEMQKFTGSQNAGNIMVQWAKDKDSFPDLLPFPTQQNQGFFKDLTEQSTEYICIATKVPTILANVSTKSHSMGAEGAMIRAAVKLMQHRTKKPQAFLERIYKEVLSHMDVKIDSDLTINNYNPFPEVDKVDQFQWAALTVEEQRAWLKKNTDFPINENVVPPKPQPAIKPPLPIPQAIASPKFSDILMNDYPEGAKKSAKEALKWKDSANVPCGTPKGWARAIKIANGDPLELKEVRKIHSWLVKNKASYGKLMNDSCDAVLFRAWGGNDMLKWSDGMIKMILK